MNDRSIDINNLGKEVTGIEDIKQSWAVILNTIKGSDPLRPDFGCGIFDYIDKPINSFTGEIAAQVISDLEKWETRCSITSVKLTYNIGQIIIKIFGTYTATNVSVEASISLDSLVIEKVSETLKRSYSDEYNKLQYS